MNQLSESILRSRRTSKESMKTLQVLNYQVSVATEIVIWMAVIIYIRISVNVNIWHKPEFCSRCSDWTVWGSKPGIGRSCVSSPKRPDRLWGQPSLLFSGYRGSFPGGRGVQLTTHLQIERRLRMSRAIPRPSLYAFVALVEETLSFSQCNLKICEGYISNILNYTA
jgi:hypothetical protein